MMEVGLVLTLAAIYCIIMVGILVMLRIEVCRRRSLEEKIMEMRHKRTLEDEVYRELCSLHICVGCDPLSLTRFYHVTPKNSGETVVLRDGYFGDGVSPTVLAQLRLLQ